MIILQGQDPPAELNNSGETGLKCPATELWRYRVAGSAGSVIIATDTSNGDTVAIKVKWFYTWSYMAALPLIFKREILELVWRIINARQ